MTSDIRHMAILGDCSLARMISKVYLFDVSISYDKDDTAAEAVSANDEEDDDNEDDDNDDDDNNNNNNNSKSILLCGHAPGCKVN